MDRAILEIKILPNFLDCFVTMLRKLQLLDFTARMQTQFVKDTKQGLKPGQVLVIADFSENFSFVVQDVVQSFHGIIYKLLFILLSATTKITEDNWPTCAMSLFRVHYSRYSGCALVSE